MGSLFKSPAPAPAPTVVQKPVPKKIDPPKLESTPVAMPTEEQTHKTVAKNTREKRARYKHTRSKNTETDTVLGNQNRTGMTG